MSASPSWLRKGTLGNRTAEFEPFEQRRADRAADGQDVNRIVENVEARDRDRILHCDDIRQEERQVIGCLVGNLAFVIEQTADIPLGAPVEVVELRVSDPQLGNHKGVVIG